ncbi:MAG: DUF4931 domain-containing protein [Candidatus Micrarchaeota archaeon]|nr:DUF4931 domain-containing protein [Candidatus Micrarchaeota archaeon]
MGEEALEFDVRKDCFGRQVVLAVSRASRPHDAPKPRLQKTTSPEKCFFCPGNEHLTPPEIDRIEVEGRWEVRCFPNKFPAFHLSSRKAYGRHEVIVETPDHQKTLSELSVENLKDYLSMLARRMQSAKEDSRIKYVSIFKNEGQAAGASLEHSHSQLVAMGFVPPYVQKMAKKKAVLEKMWGSDKKRRWHENENFFAFCPKVSRFPYETWIAPKNSLNSLLELDEGLLFSLASCLKDVLGAIDSELGYKPYNLLFHSAPFQASSFPFHLEILPRSSTWAGFEFATGVVMSSSLPEQCAKHLSDRLPK